MNERNTVWVLTNREPRDVSTFLSNFRTAFRIRSFKLTKPCQLQETVWYLRQAALNIRNVVSAYVKDIKKEFAVSSSAGKLCDSRVSRSGPRRSQRRIPFAKFQSGKVLFFRTLFAIR